MEWISIEDKKHPNSKKHISGFCLPAISKLYGYGVIVKTNQGKWSFTTDHQYFHGISHVT